MRNASYSVLEKNAKHFMVHKVFLEMVPFITQSGKIWQSHSLHMRICMCSAYEDMCV